jgi:catechol 2,3-dioxygenase-like lactoylglutathione lyase family enzyme
MLSDARFETSLPCSDLQRAKSFYADKLGLVPAGEGPAGTFYAGRDGTGFILFPSSGSASGSHPAPPRYSAAARLLFMVSNGPAPETRIPQMPTTRRFPLGRPGPESMRIHPAQGYFSAPAIGLEPITCRLTGGLYRADRSAAADHRQPA